MGLWRTQPARPGQDREPLLPLSIVYSFSRMRTPLSTPSNPRGVVASRKKDATAAVSAFCHAANPPAKCENALEKACLNQQGSPGCVACITKNTKGLTTAGCSKAAMVEFCAGP